MSVNRLPSDFKWQSAYRKLIKIRSMHPNDYYHETIKGQPNPLYNWCNSQRRNRLKLSPKHRFQLEQINFPWDSEEKQNSDKWDENYEQLVVLKAIYKNKWLDEYHDDEINPLTKWINTQRKNKNKLTEERVAKLNEIEFNWNNIVEDASALWDKNLILYRKYVAKNGTTDNPIPKIRKNSNLEIWCKYQREHKEELKEEQINLLNNAGFEWRSEDEVKDDMWNTYYNDILEYSNTHNNKLPSDNHEDKHLRHIKYWYKYQIGIKDQLTEEQAEKLSVIENRKKKPEEITALKLEF